MEQTSSSRHVVPRHLLDHSYWRSHSKLSRARKEESEALHSSPAAPVGSSGPQQASPRSLPAEDQQTGLADPRPRSAQFFPQLEDSSSLRAEETGDEPLMIHGRSAAEYRRLYHSVVDPMLRFSSGRPRPYSLQLGRRIKRRLWEAVSFGAGGEQVPHIEIDVSDEPKCSQPCSKRARR